MERTQPGSDLTARRRRWVFGSIGGDQAEIVITLPGWWLATKRFKRKLIPSYGQPTPGRNAPTFVWPAFSAARWAAAWGYAMIEIGPPHQSWKWLFLVPFMIHAWRAIKRLHIYLANRIRLAAGLEPLRPDGAYPPVGPPDARPAVDWA